MLIIDHNNRTLHTNDVLNFKDTSVQLNAVYNLYVVNDVPITELTCTLDKSNDIKLYSFSKQKYSISVSGTPNDSGTIDIQHISFNINSTDTTEQVIDKLKVQLELIYDNVILEDNVLTFDNRQFGSNPIYELSEQDFNVFGLVFDMTVLNTAENIEYTSELTLSNVQSFEQSGKYVYKLNLIFRPETLNGLQLNENTSLHTNKVLLTVNSELFEFDIKGIAIEQNDRYAVVLQNFKQFITNEYYTAFRKSDYNEPVEDAELLNTKRKEYLIQILELTGFVGAYKSLLAALEFFGYGDLLSLKEIWKNSYGVENGTASYKYTDIANQVLQYIDKSLAGYKKTNQMSLVYKVNTERTEEPVADSDNLPYYTNVFYNTDEILTKLYALKDILERDFLPLNTKIVDITGEHTSILGIDTNVWVMQFESRHHNLMPTYGINVDLEFVKTDIEILNHRVFVDPFALVPNDGEVAFIPGITTGLFDKTYFRILRVEDDNAEEYDVLTTYISIDCGLVEIDINSDVPIDSIYYEYEYTIVDLDGTILHRSVRRNVDTIEDNRLLIGIRQLGEFKLQITMFDKFGGYDMFSTINNVTIQNRYTDFKLFRTAIQSEQYRTKDIGLVSTYESKSGTVLIDPVDEREFPVSASPNLRWDIYTGVDIDTSEQHLIAKYYKEGYDLTSTRKTVNSFNGIPIREMNNVPVNTMGYVYSTALIDVIGNGGRGRRTIQLRLFPNKPFNEVELSYEPAIHATYLQYVQEFVTLLNSANSVFDKFTFSINHYSVDGTVQNVKPMIRMTSKDLSLTNRMFELSVINTFGNVFDNNFEKYEVEAVVPYHAGFEVYVTPGQSVDDLRIVYDGVTYFTTTSFVDKNDAIVRLQNLIAAHNLNIHVFANGGDTFFVTADKSLEISHVQLGFNSDIPRCIDGSTIYSFQPGSDIIIGETVFAMIDETSKLDNRNVQWFLYDSLTNELLDTQISYVFRTTLLRKKPYTIELHTVDRYGNNKRVKKGCMLVN